MQDNNYWTRFNRGRVSRRGFLVGGATVSAGLATAALIGCSSNDNGTSTSGTQVSAQPKYGGTISISTTNDAPHMDLHQTNSIFQASSGIGVVYSRLFRKKIGGGGLPTAYITEGDAVQSVETPDPTHYIFHLQRGIKYQNLPPVNGRELVANDVIQSFNRQISEKFNAELLADVASMKATDDYTLNFELKSPNADFLLALTDARAPIIPHETWELKGDLRAGPIVGSGAWMFDTFTQNQNTALKKNPTYFRTGFPYADALTFPRIPDPNTAQSAIRTGQTHLITQVNKQIADTLKSSNSSLVFVESRLDSQLGGNKIWIHNDVNNGSKLQVRQAISKAINRAAIIQAIEFGSGFLTAGTGVPDLAWQLPDDELNRLLAFDLAGAKTLMQQAGVSSWNVQFFAGIKQFASIIASAELITAQLKEIGINSTIVQVDNVQLLNNAWTNGEWDMGLGGQQPQISPTSNLEKFYKSTGSQNGYKINDPTLDGLIVQQKQAVGNPTQRKDLLQQIQRRVIDQAVLIPVETTVGGVMISGSLKNFIQSNNENSRFEMAWLE